MSTHACVGFLELSTIARGMVVADGLLKKASVELLFSRPVSPGKYLVCFAGSVEDVKSALAIGQKIGGLGLLDHFLLPSIHPEILPTLEKTPLVGECDALGIVETATCAACVIGADIALKTSAVRLLKIQLGRGIGGKGYFVVEGEVGEVESAMSAAIRGLKKGQVVDQILIAQAAPQMTDLFVD